MSVKPSTLSTALDDRILSTAVQNTSVKEPIWINNQTVLNETNMNNFRNRLIKYSDLSLKSTYSNLTQQLNRIISRTAGWQSFEATDGTFSKPIGAVFNDFDHNEATGKFSAAFGENTKARKPGQFVIGQYNIVDENSDDPALFIVGNGSDDEHRSNAFVITKGGAIKSSSTLKIVGKLSVSQAPTAGTHVVRKKELDALRDEISGALHYIGATDSLTVQDIDGNKVVTAEDEFKVFDYYDEDTKTNVFKKIDTLNNGDVVVVGQLDENNVFVASGDECIYNDGTWTYYGAYANYVPKMEYEDQVNVFNQSIQELNNADKLINKAAFGTTDTPNNIDDNDATAKHSLQKQIYDINDKITDINDEISDNLLEDLVTIMIDGGGVPHEVLNNSTNTWNGEFVGYTFREE